MGEGLPVIKEGDQKRLEGRYVGEEALKREKRKLEQPAVAKPPLKEVMDLAQLAAEEEEKEKEKKRQQEEVRRKAE